MTNPGAAGPGSDADDEADAGRAAAADVERLEVACAFHLIRARVAGHLQERVEELADAGRTHRVPRADQPAARVDRVLAVDLEPALFHGLPALAGLRDAEVVDRHVLGGGEAVVGLDAVDAVHVGDAGPLPRAG